MMILRYHYDDITPLFNHVFMQLERRTATSARAWPATKVMERIIKRQTGIILIAKIESSFWYSFAFDNEEDQLVFQLRYVG